MSESAKRHEENSNLIKEIRALMDAAIRNQGASIKTLEIQIGQMSKVLQDRGFGSLPGSTKANPRIKSSRFQLLLKLIHTRYAVLDLPNTPKEKDPGSFTLPCFINNVCFDNALVDLGASVSVMPLSTYLNLGLGELAHTKLTVELADKTVKYLKGIAENVLVGIGKFTFPIDFIILDMPEDIKVPLILGRLFLSTARAKIDVYKRKITLRLRRNQDDDLMPTIEESEVIEEYRTRDDELDAGIDDYPSYCDYDKKIHIDYKMVYKGNNVVEALMNAPIFVGTFFVVTDFTVLENMDAYRDEGMGDVSEKDKKNGISHAYQKLKGFYKGVLNLGSDYIRNAKTEEWLTRGHISVHEME
ncbi:hypothetical protein Tco_1255070 [Tanacetum coccineum]